MESSGIHKHLVNGLYQVADRVYFRRVIKFRLKFLVGGKRQGWDLQSNGILKRKTKPKQTGVLIVGSEENTLLAFLYKCSSSQEILFRCSWCPHRPVVGPVAGSRGRCDLETCTLVVCATVKHKTGAERKGRDAAISL